jgi:hypothetical protein
MSGSDNVFSERKLRGLVISKTELCCNVLSLSFKTHVSLSDLYIPWYINRSQLHAREIGNKAAQFNFWE